MVVKLEEAARDRGCDVTLEGELTYTRTHKQTQQIHITLSVHIRSLPLVYCCLIAYIS